MTQTVGEIKALLASVGVSPKRSLGQNFLIDGSKVRALVERSGVGEGDLVLEVGPGTGVLTDVLVECGCRVVASEMDGVFAGLIRERFGGAVRVVEGDCLERKGALSGEVSAVLDEEGAGECGYRLVANLPYGAASGLMVALAWDGRCAGQYVTIQREVSRRLRAEAGTRDYSELTVMVRAVSDVERVAVLPPGCFWPSPKVVSEMVAIEPRVGAREGLGDVGRERLGRLARVLFTKRRKQIGGVLGEVDWPTGVSGGMRAGDVGVGAMIALSERVEGLLEG